MGAILCAVRSVSSFKVWYPSHLLAALTPSPPQSVLWSLLVLSALVVPVQAAGGNDLPAAVGFAAATVGAAVAAAGAVAAAAAVAAALPKRKADESDEESEDGVVRCSSCKQPGHSRRSSRKCEFYGGPGPQPPAKKVKVGRNAEAAGVLPHASRLSADLRAAAQADLAPDVVAAPPPGHILGGDQRPSKQRTTCGTCGAADHERSSNKKCPNYTPRTGNANKSAIRAAPATAASAGTGDTAPTSRPVVSAIKQPLPALLHNAPPTFLTVHDSFARDYTPTVIATSLLLNAGVEAWLAAGNTLPKLDQAFLRRVLILVAWGELRVQASASLASQMPFLKALRDIWRGTPGVAPDFVATPGLRDAFPVQFAPLPIVPGAGTGVHRMINTYHSDEIDDIFNSSFCNAYQVNIEVHLEKAANKNLTTWAKQVFAALPWHLVGTRDVDHAMPQERRDEIRNNFLSAIRSRRRPLRIFSRTEALAEHHLEEATMAAAVLADTSVIYGWKTPRMQQGRTSELPAGEYSRDARCAADIAQPSLPPYLTLCAGAASSTSP